MLATQAQGGANPQGLRALGCLVTPLSRHSLLSLLVLLGLCWGTRLPASWPILPWISSSFGAFAQMSSAPSMMLRNSVLLLTAVSCFASGPFCTGGEVSDRRGWSWLLAVRFAGGLLAAPPMPGPG